MSGPIGTDELAEIIESQDDAPFILDVRELIVVSLCHLKRLVHRQMRQIKKERFILVTFNER